MSRRVCWNWVTQRWRLGEAASGSTEVQELVGGGHDVRGVLAAREAQGVGVSAFGGQELGVLWAGLNVGAEFAAWDAVLSACEGIGGDVPGPVVGGDFEGE